MGPTEWCWVFWDACGSDMPVLIEVDWESLSALHSSHIFGGQIYTFVAQLHTAWWRNLFTVLVDLVLDIKRCFYYLSYSQDFAKVSRGFFARGP